MTSCRNIVKQNVDNSITNYNVMTEYGAQKQTLFDAWQNLADAPVVDDLAVNSALSSYNAVIMPTMIPLYPDQCCYNSTTSNPYLYDISAKTCIIPSTMNNYIKYTGVRLKATPTSDNNTYTTLSDAYNNCSKVCNNNQSYLSFDIANVDINQFKCNYYTDLVRPDKVNYTIDYNNYSYSKVPTSSTNTGSTGSTGNTDTTTGSDGTTTTYTYTTSNKVLQDMTRYLRDTFGPNYLAISISLAIVTLLIIVMIPVSILIYKKHLKLKKLDPKI